KNDELQIKFKENSESIIKLKNDYESINGKYKELKSEFDKIKSKLVTLEKELYDKINKSDKINNYLLNS
ncbi:MAG TPA: hypothetical protein DIS94_12495, partial [Bacteroidetes bacterium]|nr:hypothetical protein [Bacteroidota bacterium]